VDIGGAISVDMKAVKARKDQIAGKSNVSVESGLRKLANCTVYQGHARFESPNEISVGDARLSAGRTFLNVGGRAIVPEIPGCETIEYLTNSSMMNVDFLPPHLVIIGGSYIGLEFGQMFRRFGSDVTILEHGSRLVPREDPDISDAIHQILSREGISIRLDTTCTRLAKQGSDIVLTLKSAGANSELRGS